MRYQVFSSDLKPNVGEVSKNATKSPRQFKDKLNGGKQTKGSETGQV